MSLTVPPAPSSLLAAATTVHLALASLRNHRRSGSSPLSALTIVSLPFLAFPWILPSLSGLAIGLVTHAMWFALCEKLAPVKSAGAHPAAPPATPAARGWTPLPVLDVIDRAPDIRSFRLGRPEGFDFIAGQFLTVRVTIDGRDYARCYSLSSAPHTREYLEITVKRQGLVSTVLHTTVQPGRQLMAKKPAGRFVHPADAQAPLLLVAGGIGITPVLSMLRHALVAEPRRPVTLLYSARTEEDLAFREDITALTAGHARIKTVFAASRRATSPDVYPGRVDESLIRATMPTLAGAVACLCGPQAMIEGVGALLGSLGMPAANVRSEVFEQAVAATGHAGGAAAHAGDGHAHDVRCARSGSAVKINPGQTILEAVEGAGVEIDSLCRSGVCGTCRTRVLAGAVECDSALLDANDRAHGYVLACVSHAAGDCTVDL